MSGSSNFKMPLTIDADGFPCEPSSSTTPSSNNTFPKRSLSETNLNEGAQQQQQQRALTPLHRMASSFNEFATVATGGCTGANNVFDCGGADTTAPDNDDFYDHGNEDINDIFSSPSGMFDGTNVVCFGGSKPAKGNTVKKATLVQQNSLLDLTQDDENDSLTDVESVAKGLSSVEQGDGDDLIALSTPTALDYQQQPVDDELNVSKVSSAVGLDLDTTWNKESEHDDNFLWSSPTTIANNPSSKENAANTGTSMVIEDGGWASKTSWDDVRVDNLPSDHQTFNSGGSGGFDEEEYTQPKEQPAANNAASPANKKKRRIILGSFLLLVATSVALGVVLQQTLNGKESTSEQNEAYSNAEGSVNGDVNNLTKTPSIAPTLMPNAFTIKGDQESSKEQQPTATMFLRPTTSGSQSPIMANIQQTIDPPTPQSTPSAGSEGPASNTVDWFFVPPDQYQPVDESTGELATTTQPPPDNQSTPGQNETAATVAFIPNNDDTPADASDSNTEQTPNQAAIAAPTPNGPPTDGNASGSNTVAWGSEGLFSNESKPSPSSSPPTAGPIEQVLSPTSPSASTASNTITPGPISSAPTAGPSLRPSTAKPSTANPVTSLPISILADITSPESIQTITESPTSLPSRKPITNEPTQSPSRQPTPDPTAFPTPKPTPKPSLQPSRQPTRLPTMQPTNQPSSQTAEGKVSSTGANLSDASHSNKSLLNIQLKTDQHGHETSWSLHRVNRNTNAKTVLIASRAENSYKAHEQDSVDIELAPGKYRFTLKDQYGDGFCCANGSNGWYSLSINGQEIIRGGYYLKEISHDILAGNNAQMSERDEQWLEAHNTRRKIWHEQYGETYVPLSWSTTLASDAKSWASHLLNDCEIPGIAHESNTEEGENLAKNKASGGNGGMGILYHPDNILQRWVEQEKTWGYPRNAHLTQALWRASRYLGCGDAVKRYDDGSICRTQVCRYVRAGNCAMNSHNAREGDNWLVPMLMEDSRCGPRCPVEGCY